MSIWKRNLTKDEIDKVVAADTTFTIQMPSIPPSMFAGSSLHFQKLPRNNAVPGLTPSTTGAIARMGDQLPSREQTETVRGWKSGTIEFVNKTVRIRGMAARESYGVEAAAECLAGPGPGNCSCSDCQRNNPAWRKDHQVPDPGCTCGFYATKERKHTDFVGSLTHCLFDVELSGRIIHHEKGYRAEKQRVLRIITPPCFGLLCKNASAGVVYDHDDPEQRWACDEHRYTDIAVEFISLAQIQNKLGTEVISEPYQTKQD